MAQHYSKQDLREIIDAAQAYDAASPHYDGVFNDTGHRLRSQGFATKQDIAVVTFWKAVNLSTPWVRKLLNTEPRIIRDATQAAFRPNIHDWERLIALEKLPGFGSWRGRTGGAIPSTVLCCWDPEEFAVTDIRARERLDLVGIQVNGLLEYWEAIRELRDAARQLLPSVSARDIDKALFRLAGDRKRL